MSLTLDPSRTDVHSYWRVSVVNVRSQPLEVTSVGLRIENSTGRRDALLTPCKVLDAASTRSYPIVVPPGQSISFYFERRLHGDTRIVGAYVRDILDNVYRGRTRERTPRALIQWIRSSVAGRPTTL